MDNKNWAIFDNLSQVTPSDERGINFPALTVVGREFDIVEEKLRDELEKRTLGANALPVIFPILANANLNSQIAVYFRSSLQKKLWNFLIPDGDAETFLIKYQKEFMKNPNDESSYGFFMNPYVQTGLFISECCGLDLILTGGLIKLQEHSGATKDRFSSVSYCNWVISSHFDKFLLREIEEQDNLSVYESMTMVF